MGINVFHRYKLGEAFSITFSEGGSFSSLSASGANENLLQATASSLILQTNSPGGLVFATASSPNQLAGGFTFKVNEAVIANLGPNGLVLPMMTSEERLGAPPVEARVVYDSTIKKICFYNGNEWEQIVSIPIKETIKKRRHGKG